MRTSREQWETDQTAGSVCSARFGLWGVTPWARPTDTASHQQLAAASRSSELRCKTCVRTAAAHLNTWAAYRGTVPAPRFYHGNTRGVSTAGFKCRFLGF